MGKAITTTNSKEVNKLVVQPLSRIFCTLRNKTRRTNNNITKKGMSKKSLKSKNA